MCAKQLFLDRINTKVFQTISKPEMTITNWNISNPSQQRAIKQVNWLLKTDSDILTLTETKSSKGCTYIKDRLESFGYHVIFPRPKANEYGVLVASKLQPTETDFLNKIDFSPRARVVSISVPFLDTELEIIAVYVPNERDEKRSVS